MRESEVEQQCDRLAVRVGYTVIRLSQRRRTRIHPGLPDRRYQGPRGAVFFEVKPADGRLSTEQFDFLVAELTAGELASVGGFLELQEIFAALVTSRDTARAACRRHLQFWAAKGFRKAA